MNHHLADHERRARALCVARSERPDSVHGGNHGGPPCAECRDLVARMDAELEPAPRLQ